MQDFKNLRVWQMAHQLAINAYELSEYLREPKAWALRDQILKAVISIPSNIAEGAGEYSSNEKGRFYRMAKRSATECAGIFDVCFRLKLIEEEQHRKGRDLLLRIVSMLTKMAKVNN